MTVQSSSLLPVDYEIVKQLEKRNKFSRALSEQIRIVSALVMREALTRYGNSRLGYLWAFVEPSLFFIGFLILKSLIKDTVPFGESALIFMLSGLLAVKSFGSISRGMMRSISSNIPLMAFPAVVPLDAVIARGAIEIMTSATIISVFYVLVIYFDNTVRINDMVTFTAALLALFALGTGVGCFNSVISTLFPGYKTFYGLLTFPLLICSGVLYVPGILPPEVLYYLAWNPVLHAVEWFRVAIYIDYIPVLDRGYVLNFAGITFGMGIIMARIFQVRLLS